MNKLKGFLFLIILLVAVSCKNDAPAENSTDAQADESTKIEALKKKTNAQNNAQTADGQNDHAHSDKPKAIENNERVAVPVQKIRKQSPPEYGAPEPAKTKSQMQAEFREGMQSAVIRLPEPCGLLSDAFIANVIGVDKDAITLKDGSNPATPYARSCFFRWEHKGTPNSGVLIQVQSNPVPNEFPEWAPYYLQAKRNQGEKTADGAYTFKYKNLEGMGVDGAYSFDLHRYIWRDAKDYVYMVAFNLPATESEEMTWAKKLGKELMKNANL